MISDMRLAQYTAFLHEHPEQWLGIEGLGISLINTEYIIKRMNEFKETRQALATTNDLLTNYMLENHHYEAMLKKAQEKCDRLEAEIRELKMKEK